MFMIKELMDMFETDKHYLIDDRLKLLEREHFIIRLGRRRYGKMLKCYVRLEIPIEKKGLFQSVFK